LPNDTSVVNAEKRPMIDALASDPVRLKPASSRAMAVPLLRIHTVVAGML